MVANGIDRRNRDSCRNYCNSTMIRAAALAVIALSGVVPCAAYTPASRFSLALRKPAATSSCAGKGGRSGRLPQQSRLGRKISSRPLLAMSLDGPGDVPDVFGASRTSVWRWIETEKIRYASSGDGNKKAPIVMIHGFGSSADTWREQYAALAAAGHPVYGIDLLGFGGSDKPVEASYSINLWARQVLDFVEEVVGKQGHGESAILFGNSIGSLGEMRPPITPRVVHALPLSIENPIISASGQHSQPNSSGPTSKQRRMISHRDPFRDLQSHAQQRRTRRGAPACRAWFSTTALLE